jgi:hypothetical protein
VKRWVERCGERETRAGVKCNCYITTWSVQKGFSRLGSRTGSAVPCSFLVLEHSRNTEPIVLVIVVNAVNILVLYIAALLLVLHPNPRTGIPTRHRGTHTACPSRQKKIKLETNLI